MDADGDGKIRDEQFSLESSYAADVEIIFRLGDMYLSTEKIDVAKNRITLRTTIKDEYLRHDIEVGKMMTDFSFVDFEGKTRSHYEFKGIMYWSIFGERGPVTAHERRSFTSKQ